MSVVGGHEAGDRTVALRRLLEREGVMGTAGAVGREGEIAAIRGRPELRARLAELAPAIRELGFRYVALEPGSPTEDEKHT